MSINRPTFSNVLDGKHAVSRELAYKLEALTGVDAELLIRMQLAHDLAQEREKRSTWRRRSSASLPDAISSPSASGLS
jgi:plasmid maintenance system antidote protein VapI